LVETPRVKIRTPGQRVRIGKEKQTRLKNRFPRHRLGMVGINFFRFFIIKKNIPYFFIILIYHVKNKKNIILIYFHVFLIKKPKIRT
jgi:hypothetical protein